jgi:hypothetical protein
MSDTVNNLMGFNAETIEPAAPRTIMPAADYLCHAVESEMRATRNGNGEYLWIEFVVLEGEHKGRRVWDRINLVNTNTTAVEIGQRQLSALCRACGVLQPKGSQELHSIPVLVSVGIQPAKDNYEARNIVKGYKSARTAPAKAPEAAAPPWRRK